MTLWGKKVEEINQKEARAESQLLQGGVSKDVSPQIKVQDEVKSQSKVTAQKAVNISTDVKPVQPKQKEKSVISSDVGFSLALMDDGHYKFAGSLAGALRKSKGFSTFKVLTPQVMHNFLMISKFNEKLTAIEIVNLLIIDAVERDTLPLAMLKRYKKSVGDLVDAKEMPSGIVSFSNNQISFNHPFSSKTDSPTDFTVAIYPVPKEIYSKFLILKLKHEVTIVEAFHILIADFMEKNKVPVGVKKRYQDGL